LTPRKGDYSLNTIIAGRNNAEENGAGNSTGKNEQ
jgi:hypothetical protein